MSDTEPPVDDAILEVRRELEAGPGGQPFVDLLLGPHAVERRRLPVLSGKLDEVGDKYALRDLPRIDCLARLAACRGRCCGFSFTLSLQDVADGVRYDPQNPYTIAHGPDGLCVHSKGGQCTIYEKRPAICRTYECSNDPRIWIDFEKGIARP